MKIGVAGTGRMGAAIAQRLMTLGHEVTVWNRTIEKTQALAAAGAKVAATPFQAASFSETAITILTDAAPIDTAYHAKDGLLSGNVPGNPFIEMGTVRPETERELAARIREKGAAMIECPVGGTAGRARDGKLFASPPTKPKSFPSRAGPTVPPTGHSVIAAPFSLIPAASSRSGSGRT